MTEIATLLCSRWTRRTSTRRRCATASETASLSYNNELRRLKKKLRNRSEIQEKLLYGAIPFLQFFCRNIVAIFPKALCTVIRWFETRLREIFSLEKEHFVIVNTGLRYFHSLAFSVQRVLASCHILCVRFSTSSLFLTQFSKDCI